MSWLRDAMKAIAAMLAVVAERLIRRPLAFHGWTSPGVWLAGLPQTISLCYMIAQLHDTVCLNDMVRLNHNQL
jgi:hypothetical protein